jgi:Asp/Glu/hydantoin racemase
MTTTSQPLTEQCILLDKFSDIILALITNPAASFREKAEAEAKVEELLAADRANAELIVAGNAKLQELLDAAMATLLPIPVVDSVEEELE